MSVYFAYSMRGNLMKIGTSYNVETRLKGIRVMTGLKVVSLLVRPGHLPEERLYHKRFCDVHVLGEWFDFDGSLLEFVCADAAARKTLRAMGAATKATMFHDADIAPILTGAMAADLRAKKRRPEEVKQPNSGLPLVLKMEHRR